MGKHRHRRKHKKQGAMKWLKSDLENRCFRYTTIPVHLSKELETRLDKIINGCNRLWNGYIDFNAGGNGTKGDRSSRLYCKSRVYLGYVINKWRRGIGEDPNGNMWNTLFVDTTATNIYMRILKLLENEYNKAFITYKATGIFNAPDKRKTFTKQIHDIYISPNSITVHPPSKDKTFIMTKTFGRIDVDSTKGLPPDSDIMGAMLTKIGNDGYVLTLKYGAYKEDKNENEQPVLIYGMYPL